MEQRKKMSFSVSGLEFIYMAASPPCRAVWMCIKALNIPEVDYRHIDMYKKAEHTQSWFVKVKKNEQIAMDIDDTPLLLLLRRKRALIGH